MQSVLSVSCEQAEILHFEVTSMKQFTKPNVIADLKSRISNAVWNKNHLPLTDDLRKKYDNDIVLLESIIDDIREMS